jgi:hypothetical protein
MSRVEIFTNNEWVINSWHKNLDHAIINAEVLYVSRKCDIRVINEGKIVWAKGGDNYLIDKI